MTIREIVDSDRSGWVRLREALWPGSLADHEAETRQYFEQTPRLPVVLVAETEGALVGFLELDFRKYAPGCSSSPVPFIEGWFVEPAYQGRGIGRALIEAAEAHARAAGHHEIASDAEIENADGIAAHRALGYSEVERVVCFRKSLLGALLAVLLGLAAGAMAGDHFSDEVKGLPSCGNPPPTPAPASWQRTDLNEIFSIALPSCSQAPEEELRYVHGGTSWSCGTATVEVVWGMWGSESFGETGTRCTAKVAGRRVMVVRDRHDDGPATLVWYPTGDVHEPIVSVWSSRVEDADLVAAIAFSGRIKKRR